MHHVTWQARAGYIHTHTHTSIHTYTHTHTYTRSPDRRALVTNTRQIAEQLFDLARDMESWYVCVHLCVNACVFVCMHVCNHAWVHVCTIYVYINTHTYMRIHTRIHTYIHTHIRTFTDFQVRSGAGVHSLLRRQAPRVAVSARAQFRGAYYSARVRYSINQCLTLYMYALKALIHVPVTVRVRTHFRWFVCMRFIITHMHILHT